MSFIAATHDPSGPNGPPPHFLGRKISPPLELLVHPDLDGVRLEKAVRRLALLLVGDVADDDRDHEIALVGDGDALGEALGAILELVLVESRAADEIRDADPAYRLRWLGPLVPEIDVGDAVDFVVGHHAGLAIAAETELGADIDIGLFAPPAAPRRPAVARKRPGDGMPAGAVGRS